MSALPDTPSFPSVADPVRVMVVDDSAVIRGFLTRFIESNSSLRVVVSAPNGQQALGAMGRTSVDVVVLDIEMPVMDGLTALPLILKEDPAVQVIIASTLTRENAAITLKALQAGAAECLAKPMSHELSGSTIFRDELIEKVVTLGQLARKKRAGRPAKSGGTAHDMPAAKATAPAAGKSFSLRSEGAKVAPDVIAIGSSTGGPQALLQFFTELKGNFKQPIFVTQHMPPTFTTILAEHIAKQAGLTCKEGAEGDIVQGGQIYLAPGNYHMVVKSKGGQKVISLNQDEPENFCRPAVDPMMRSIVSAYGKKILAVIFTGMGADGMKGCKEVVEAGGVVLAQDEPSSVVWGMPGAVAMAGICTKVLPLGKMAQAVREYIDIGRTA